MNQKFLHLLSFRAHHSCAMNFFPHEACLRAVLWNLCPILSQLHFMLMVLQHNWTQHVVDFPSPCLSWILEQMKCEASSVQSHSDVRLTFLSRLLSATEQNTNCFLFFYYSPEFIKLVTKWRVSLSSYRFLMEIIIFSHCWESVQ